MISEFSVTPKASNNKARHVFFLLLILSVAAMAVYSAVEVYKGLVGVVTVAMITSAIYVFVRYIACVFHYDIMIDSDGTPLLVVRKTTGKSESTLARIELGSIISVTRESAQERREHKTEKGVLKYVYTPTMSPKVTYLITSHSSYERTEIRIEANDDFAALLTSYSAEAREYSNTDGEDY